MRRSAILATILVKSELYPNTHDAEGAVRLAFAHELPGQPFDDWNVDVEVERAKSFIKEKGSCSGFNERVAILEMRGL